MYPTPLPSQHLSDSNRRIIETDAPSLRHYQIWKGNNRFFFGGRLIFGPDARSLFLSIFLIAAPVILFCAFVSPRLVNEFPHHLGRLVVAICVVFAVYVIGLLLLTSGRDPGIIPRNPHPPEPEDDGDGSSISTDWTGSQGGVPALPPTKNVTVNGMVVRVKYCQTCMLYRPPRCSHCSICNNCVERFDHHCPWVGQCIGKRNYRFFFMFVSSTTLLCLYVFAFCCLNIIKIMNEYHCNLWRAIVKSPASGILLLYTFIVSWFVGGLTSFHIYLIITNQTTYENFRHRYDRKMNPYNLGFVRNIGEVFFSKIPGSKNDFRAKAKSQSSSSFSHTSPYLGITINSELPKTSFDLEMGKRQAVDANEIEDIQNEFGNVGERCGSESETEHKVREREKIHGSL